MHLSIILRLLRLNNVASFQAASISAEPAAAPTSAAALSSQSMPNIGSIGVVEGMETLFFSCVTSCLCFQSTTMVVLPRAHRKTLQQPWLSKLTSFQSSKYLGSLTTLPCKSCCGCDVKFWFIPLQDYLSFALQQGGGAKAGQFDPMLGEKKLAPYDITCVFSFVCFVYTVTNRFLPVMLAETIRGSTKRITSFLCRS